MPEEGAKVFLDISVPGGYSFKLNLFQGVERLSNLFEYTVLMTAQSRDVNFDTLMRQSATVSLTVGSEKRTFNGIIGHFEQQATPFAPLNMWNVYRAVLYPKVWLLTFSGQCQIFQNKSALTIIQQILDDNGIPYTNRVSSAGRQAREFCVQYNETYFNFISRLMEEEGIFYYFEQNEEGHKIVLADFSETSPPCPNAISVSFHDSAIHEPFMMTVSSCFIHQHIVPSTNTLISYNYLSPQNRLKGTASGPTDAEGGDITNYREVFTEQTIGDTLTQVKLQSEDAHQKRVEGVSLVPFFLPGYSFTLKDHPRSDANITYVLYEVRHEARIVEGGGNPLYKNQYQAFPSTEPFKAPQVTPPPRIYGTQTAKVTGKQGEEIYTEEYGRIKVKFHWDSSEQEDESTSCWIRVATLWSGQKWGTLFTPRVGQEVVVSFLDGNPDKPLVIGTVYNGENKPPYLPDEPTKSTILSQTSKSEGEGTSGYNELRFEDKKKSEEIYMHAQKDFNVDIQNDHKITIVGGSRTIELQAQAEEGEGEEQEQGGGEQGGEQGGEGEEQQGEQQGEQGGGKKCNDSLKLNNGDKTLQIVKGNYSIELDEGNITIKCQEGNVEFNITGDVTYTCTGSFDVTANEINLTATADMTVSAGGELSCTGGGTVEIEGASVEVMGAIITLNG